MYIYIYIYRGVNPRVNPRGTDATYTHTKRSNFSVGRWPLAWRKIWAVSMFDLAVQFVALCVG